MPVNLNKPEQWKEDVAKSVDMYNDWLMRFAPKAFRETRVQTTKDVESALRATKNLIHHPQRAGKALACRHQGLADRARIQAVVER